MQPTITFHPLCLSLWISVITIISQQDKLGGMLCMPLPLQDISSTNVTVIHIVFPFLTHTTASSVTSLWMMHFLLLSSQPVNYNKSKINFRKGHALLSMESQMKPWLIPTVFGVCSLDPQSAPKPYWSLSFNKVYRWEREDQAKISN